LTELRLRKLTKMQTVNDGTRSLIESVMLPDVILTLRDRAKGTALTKRKSPQAKLPLRDHGLEETKGSIAAKISRGAFPATFFIAVMKAIGRQTVNLEEM